MRPFGSIAAACLLLASVAAGEAADPALPACPLAGSWRAHDTRYYVTCWGERYYVIRATDGRTWTLTEEDERYGVHGMDGSATGTSLRVGADGTWSVEPDGGLLHPAARIRRRAESFTALNGEEAELHGTILWPEKLAPRGWIVYLNGEGPNPRTDLLPTALGLLEHGYGAVIFDQRGAGESTGEANEGSYRERSLRAAGDAVAVTRAILGDARFSGLPVGVLGWSQGGWIGSIVARNSPGVDFYVNVAGNAAPGWRQWRHSIESRLVRAGVNDDQRARASFYFDAFFGAMWGEVSWAEYTAALAVAREEPWWAVMRRRNIAEWESEEEAAEFRRREEEHTPAADFRRVSVPSLGIFFEFDGSSTPDSPGLFAAALAESDAPEFAVVQLAGLQHGSWRVGGYADLASRLATRSPEVDEVIAGWLGRVIGRRATSGSAGAPRCYGNRR